MRISVGIIPTPSQKARAHGSDCHQGGAISSPRSTGTIVRSTKLTIRRGTRHACVAPLDLTRDRRQRSRWPARRSRRARSASGSSRAHRPAPHESHGRSSTLLMAARSSSRSPRTNQSPCSSKMPNSFGIGVAGAAPQPGLGAGQELARRLVGRVEVQARARRVAACPICASSRTQRPSHRSVIQ